MSTNICCKYSYRYYEKTACLVEMSGVEPESHSTSYNKITYIPIFNVAGFYYLLMINNNKIILAPFCFQASAAHQT